MKAVSSDMGNQPKFELPIPHDAYAAYNHLTTMQVHPQLNVAPSTYYSAFGQPSYDIVYPQFDFTQP